MGRSGVVDFACMRDDEETSRAFFIGMKWGVGIGGLSYLYIEMVFAMISWAAQCLGHEDTDKCAELADYASFAAIIVVVLTGIAVFGLIVALSVRGEASKKAPARSTRPSTRALATPADQM